MPRSQRLSCYRRRLRKHFFFGMCLTRGHIINNKLLFTTHRFWSEAIMLFCSQCWYIYYVKHDVITLERQGRHVIGLYLAGFWVLFYSIGIRFVDPWMWNKGIFCGLEVIWLIIFIFWYVLYSVFLTNELMNIIWSYGFSITKPLNKSGNFIGSKLTFFLHPADIRGASWYWELTSS